MTRELFMLFGCTLLAFIYQLARGNAGGIDEKGRLKAKTTPVAEVLFWILCFIMVCHSGLRTYMNDTYAYIKKFNSLSVKSVSQIFDVDWSFGANPLFNVYKAALKYFISDSGNVFIFTSSLISVTLYLLYIKKHAEKFTLTVYIFIAFCAYGFTMVAIKQSIATSIGLWAVDCFLDKKYIPGVMILVCAMLFHPYVVFFAVLPFLSDGIWNKKTVAIVVIALLCGVLFSSFTGLITTLASEAFGDEYREEIFASGTGVRFVRFVVYAAVPAVSFVYREQLKKTDNKYIYLCVNASIIAMCFVFVGLFGGGIALGRMANFFDVFCCLATCYIVKYGEKDDSQRQMLTIAIVVCFFIYYYVYNWKYIPSWSGDLYDHITFSELLNRW